MRKFVLFLLLLGVLCAGCPAASAQNPFTTDTPAPRESASPGAAVAGNIFTRITQWQFQLKEKMTALIRDSKEKGQLAPLVFLLGIGLAYGALHAAGPGHGKFAAASYALSHRASVAGGICFAVCIAFLHGFSGVVGVLGLSFFLQRGLSASLADTTAVTQLVSFGLIFLLGLWIFFNHGRSLLPGTRGAPPAPSRVDKRGAGIWVLALGLVPCPAVVMVMLFCISLETVFLGFLMASAISLGMAITISVVVTAVVMGKDNLLKKMPEKHIHRIESVLGTVTGAAVALAGLLLLMAQLHSQ